MPAPPYGNVNAEGRRERQKLLRSWTYGSSEVGWGGWHGWQGQNPCIFPHQEKKLINRRVYTPFKVCQPAEEG